MDFQIRASITTAQLADLEIGDTAGLETWFGNLRYGAVGKIAAARDDFSTY